MQRIAAMSSRLDDAQIQDVINNPEMYGAPSFEEYVKNRDKYIKTADKTLAMLDESTQSFKDFLKEQVYYLDGVRAESLEHLQRMANSMGVSIENCKKDIQIVESSEKGKFKTIVNLKSLGMII